MCTVMPKNQAESCGLLANQRGVAILVAIGVVAVLLTAGLALNRRIRDSVSGAIYAANRMKLSEMATSGVHVAMVMLINDRRQNSVDTLHEDWANPEKIAEMMALIPFEDGSLDIKITDERSKIQVNALVKFPEGQQFVAAQRGLWERLLDQIFSLFEETPDTDRNMIINSLKDWLDSGDDDATTGLSGTPPAASSKQFDAERLRKPMQQITGNVLAQAGLKRTKEPVSTLKLSPSLHAAIEDAGRRNGLAPEEYALRQWPSSSVERHC